MMRHLLSSSLLFIILVSCFLKRSNALEGRKDTAIDSHYHIVKISSLLPASVCNPSTIKGSNKQQPTLQVLHRHGPCSHQGQNTTTTTPPPLHQILADDQSRVDSIQARINPNKTTNPNPNPNHLNEQKQNIPAQSGLSLGSGNYIVAVGLGTPRVTLSFIFDTGSDLTWTQCEPCIRSCYRQQDPIFDPSASTTYSNVSCDSPQCSELVNATGYDPRCSTSTCIYMTLYGDRSYSVGYLSRDKLSITERSVFPSFYFGCGQNNQGLFGQTAGILGLGRNPLSVVSQTARTYRKYFSYCLPSTPSSTGHLTLGKNRGIPRNLKFTPFANNKDTSFYYVNVVSIRVGGRILPIAQSVFEAGGSIIDSGTVITRLQPAAYEALSAAFQAGMTNYPSAPAYSILDTCYDFSGYDTIRIPTVSIAFRGNVEIKLDPSAILVGVGQSRACLAFSGNGDASDVAIFGNTQQKTFEVVYDVGGGKLGFAPGGCS